MSDHEENTIDERDPGPSTAGSTDSGVQNMPSANAFVGMFTAALAPVLSQLTNLNENMGSLLLNGKTTPMRTVKPPLMTGPQNLLTLMQIYPRFSFLGVKTTTTRLYRERTY